jgi:hypothetical protein
MGQHIYIKPPAFLHKTALTYGRYILSGIICSDCSAQHHFKVDIQRLSANRTHNIILAELILFLVCHCDRIHIYIDPIRLVFVVQPCPRNAAPELNESAIMDSNCFTDLSLTMRQHGHTIGAGKGRVVRKRDAALTSRFRGVCYNKKCKR